MSDLTVGKIEDLKSYTADSVIDKSPLRDIIKEFIERTKYDMAEAQEDNIKAELIKLGWIPPIEVKYKVVDIKETSCACPSQWEGQLEDGRLVYIRYRSGHLGLSISKNQIVLGEKWDFNDMEPVFDDHIGDWLDGYLTLKQVAENAKEFDFTDVMYDQPDTMFGDITPEEMTKRIDDFAKKFKTIREDNLPKQFVGHREVITTEEKQMTGAEIELRTSGLSAKISTIEQSLTVTEMFDQLLIPAMLGLGYQRESIDEYLVEAGYVIEQDRSKNEEGETL